MAHEQERRIGFQRIGAVASDHNVYFIPLFKQRVRIITFEILFIKSLTSFSPEPRDRRVRGHLWPMAFVINLPSHLSLPQGGGWASLLSHDELDANLRVMPSMPFS